MIPGLSRKQNPMKKSRVLIFCIIMISCQGFGAGELHIAGSRGLAMGSATVALSDFWSVFNNPAGSAWEQKIKAGFSFENRFLVKELSYKVMGLSIPLKPGNIGITASQYGNSLYSEIKAGLSFSRKFGKYFAASVQLDYFRVQIAESYGNKNMISFEVGLFYKAGRSISLGLHFLNPVPIKLGTNPPEFLPMVIRLGIAYTFSPAFLAIVEAEKDINSKMIIKAGAEYHFARSFYARLGISTNPTLFSFGFGLGFGRFSFDFASGYHPVLGFTPSGSLIFSFQK